MYHTLASYNQYPFLPITLLVVRGGFVMGDLIPSAQFFNLFIQQKGVPLSYNI